MQKGSQIMNCRNCGTEITKSMVDELGEVICPGCGRKYRLKASPAAETSAESDKAVRSEASGTENPVPHKKPIPAERPVPRRPVPKPVAGSTDNFFKRFMALKIAGQFPAWIATLIALTVVVTVVVVVAVASPSLEEQMVGVWVCDDLSSVVQDYGGAMFGLIGLFDDTGISGLMGNMTGSMSATLKLTMNEDGTFKLLMQAGMSAMKSDQALLSGQWKLKDDNLYLNNELVAEEVTGSTITIKIPAEDLADSFGLNSYSGYGGYSGYGNSYLDDTYMELNFKKQ